MTRATVVLLSCCAALSAQQPIWWQTGIQDKLAIGGRTVFLGDLDQDGFEDLAHPATFLLDAATGRTTDITIVRSGRDGSILRADYGSSVCWRWNWYDMAAVGDVDGDGINDYARSWYDVGCNQPGVVAVHSGRTGQRLWWVQGKQWNDQFGSWVAGGADLNGDGRPDVLVHALYEPIGGGQRGVLYAYDHAGKPIFQIPMPAYDRGIGVMGDLDQDGCNEFLVGTQDASGRNTVQVHSGRTQAILISGFGDFPNDRLGTGMVAGCGDIDRDGVLDFAGSCYAGFGTNPLVRVFSGRTGQPLHTWREVGKGRLVSGPDFAVADFDLDGVLDFAFRTIEGFSPGRVAIVSGKDGVPLIEILMPANGDIGAWGDNITIGKPRPGGPFPPLVVSEPAYGSSGTVLRHLGRYWMYRPVPATVTVRGEACAASSQPPPAIGWRALAQDLVRLHLSQAPPGGSGLLLVGLSDSNWGSLPLPLPLGAIGLPNCLLHNSVDAWVLLPIGTSGLARGFTSIDLPAGTALPQRVHTQWITFDVRAAIHGTTPSLSWR